MTNADTVPIAKKHYQQDYNQLPSKYKALGSLCFLVVFATFSQTGSSTSAFKQ